MYLARPLGETLRKAGLISQAQLLVALLDQVHTFSCLRLGEILVQRGWVNAETVEFFSERLATLVANGPSQPIGQYLKFAGILTERQVETILKVQQKTGLRFGLQAILTGWLQPQTLHFFLDFAAAIQELHVPRPYTPTSNSSGQHSWSPIPPELEDDEEDLQQLQREVSDIFGSFLDDPAFREKFGDLP
jgi:hypothetical protein